MRNNKFHLAFPVTNLGSAKKFYTETIGCQIGRESEKWVDFDFFGHQITAHLVKNIDRIDSNSVDKEQVPVRHFGLVLTWNEWQTFSTRLKNNNVLFLIEPQIRFKGKPGEQATLFITDPSNNALEFKAFRDPNNLFRK